MSHLRHCPKHKKLLPCAHCALTHKPAPVAVAEPVPKSAPARSAPTPKPCGGCDQKRCRYCYPEKQEQTSHLTGRHTGKWNHAPCGDCGLVTCRYCHPENQTTPPDLTHKEIVARFGGIYLPGILGLSRVALTRLLNTPVGFRTEPDHNHPPQKLLKSPAGVKTELAEMKAQLAPMKIRIEELKKLILETQHTIDGLGKKVMVIRRGKDHPDDPLLHDNNTREQLLNEEKKKLATYNREKQEIETSRRSMWQKIGILQSEVDTWESNPANYEMKPVMTEVPIPFEEKFEPPDVVVRDGKFKYVGAPESAPFDGFLLTGYEFGVAAYRELVQIYDVDNQVNVKKSGVWRRWMWFENEIIIQAYRRHLIEVPTWAFKFFPKHGETAYLEKEHGPRTPDYSERNDLESDDFLDQGDPETT